MGNLIDYFDSLGLKDWAISGNLGHGGQAEVVEVRNIKTNDIGVFRTLKRKEQKDIDRFNRELLILNACSHTNIIKLLDCTKEQDHQWYISKKGERFATYWNHQYNTIKKPDDLLVEAIKVIESIADGLMSLHDNGVIHRDIKAANIIIENGNPVLIDFGIAFIAGEERLTPVDDAVANIYSPDPALNFMEDVPPWLDVFLLSQLLIWMVSEGTNKPHIQRPLDWRWVIYPQFSDDNLLKVRALTAACSNYFTSPKNARELKALIESLFMKKETNNSSIDSQALQRIYAAIEAGKATQVLQYSDIHSIIESHIPYFIATCKKFEAGILNIESEIQKSLPIKIYDWFGVDAFIQSLQKEIKTKIPPVHPHFAFRLRLGTEPNSHIFWSKYQIHTSTSTEKRFKDIQNTPYIILNGSGEIKIDSHSDPFYLVPQADGKTRVLKDDDNLSLIKETTIEEIIGIIRNTFLNPELWEAMNNIKKG